MFDNIRVFTTCDEYGDTHGACKIEDSETGAGYWFSFVPDRATEEFNYNVVMSGYAPGNK